MSELKPDCSAYAFVNCPICEFLSSADDRIAELEAELAITELALTNACSETWPAPWEQSPAEWKESAREKIAEGGDGDE